MASTMTFFHIIFGLSKLQYLVTSKGLNPRVAMLCRYCLVGLTDHVLRSTSKDPRTTPANSGLPVNNVHKLFTEIPRICFTFI
jgi:hypothetical protein